MAACTTYFDLGQAQTWPAQIANHNAELLAQQTVRRRGVRTPEIMFTKHFDNTRLLSKLLIRSVCVPDAHFLGYGRGSVLAGHGVWPAALQRHRRLLPRRV